MDLKYYCSICKCSFARKYILNQHNKSNKHLKRADLNNTVFKCSCGKSYTQKKSLAYHMKTSNCEPLSTTTTTTTNTTNNNNNTNNNTTTTSIPIENTIEELREKLTICEAQIAMLLDKQASVSAAAAAAAAGQTINTTNNNHNNITININAFGNENTDYLDDKLIIECIERVYKSIPTLIEKIHFDPKHPENNNIKITNKKLPYASVMGKNQKWTTVDRKNAIETMVYNGYNLLDLKYHENKEKLPLRKQQHFEGFQSKFENEDKELIKQIKTDVEMMVMNGEGV